MKTSIHRDAEVFFKYPDGSTIETTVPVGVLETGSRAYQILERSEQNLSWLGRQKEALARMEVGI